MRKSRNIYSYKTSKDKNCKATSFLSLFLFKMIAKLERTQSNALQNKDKHRTLTTNGKHTKQRITNDGTIALERTAA